MANKVNIDIVSPDKNFFSGDADMLIVRTVDGDMAVMFDHELCVTPLSVGSIKIINGSEKRIGAHAGGFLHVDFDKTTVITESVEWAENIDKDRAAAAKERAIKRLESKDEDLDVKRARYALIKAINRLHISEIK